MKAMDMAEYIITKASQEGKPVSNLMLQKTMYFLNVIYLLRNNKPLINPDTKFERWDYGPVIRDVYFEYANFGSNTIPSPSIHITLDKNNKVKINQFNPNNLNEDEKSFINNNINKLLKFKPFDLVNKSHVEPQWKDNNTNYKYDDQKSINFYSDRNNQFWRY